MTRQLVLQTLLLFACQISVFSAEPAFRSWAIVTSPEIRETGIADLLVVQLSREQLELVERDKIDRLTQELELSQLLGAAGSSHRLQLGQRVGADAMILVSQVTQNNTPAVRLVICDCVYGSRLLLEHFPQSDTNAAVIADAAARAVVQTRERFRNGVESVITVSPILSKNLTRDFDHFQYGFAALLGQSLSNRPGIAVLEIEEARAISDELRQSNGRIRKRKMPLFVEGEFRVMRSESTSKPVTKVRSCEITLRDHGGKSSQPDLVYRGNSPAAVTRWLTDVAPGHFAKQSTATRPRNLTSIEQRKSLLKRAEQFSMVSAYEQSTALREAALLLSPDNWEDRLRLYNDYRSWAELRRLKFHELRRDPKSAEDVEQIDLNRKRFGEIQTHHLEVVLQTADLNSIEYSELIRENLYDRRMHRIVPDADLDYGQDARDFYWRNMPRIAQLDPDIRKGALHELILRNGALPKEMTPERQFQLWVSDGFYDLTSMLPSMSLQSADNPNRKYRFQTIASDLKRFFTELIPPEKFHSGMAIRMTRMFPGLVRLGVAEARDVEAFLDDLAAMEHPIHQFYGRFGYLVLRSQKRATRPIDKSDLQEIQRLRDSITRWENVAPGQRGSAASAARGALMNLRSVIEKQLTTGQLVKKHKLSTNPSAGVDPAPRIVFEPIADLKLSAKFLEKVTSQLDLLWSRHEVWLMPARGELQSICRIRHDDDFVFHAACDGTFVWVATIEDGIRIFDLTGNLNGQFSPDGRSATSSDTLPQLPKGPRFYIDRHYFAIPFRRPVLLFPMSPGRCLVSAQVEVDKRRWFGEISLDKNTRRLQYRSLLEATRKPSSTGVNDPVDTSFEPAFFLRCRLPGRADAVLTARPCPRNGSGVAKTALAFDFETGSPQVLSGLEIPGISSRIHEALQIRNDLVVANDNITRFTPPARGLNGQWKAEPILTRNSGPWPFVGSQGSWRNQMFFDDEHITVPGNHWFQIDTRSWDCELLNTQIVVPRYRFQNFGHSAHYGIVAWHTNDTLHRVHIDRKFRRNELDKWQYGYVPTAQAATHRAAVDALRKLGASVVAQPPGHTNGQFGRKATTEWLTMVYLSDKWKGGDTGLTHLKDLYALEELVLVKADVSNAGLRTIGDLHGLKALSLEETKATDAGLQHLTGLKSLKFLRLEGAGQEFTDAGLARLTPLSQLLKLIIYGEGFTDISAETLKTFPMIRDVRLLQTSVSNLAIENLTAKRRSLRIQSSMSGHMLFW